MIGSVGEIDRPWGVARGEAEQMLGFQENQSSRFRLHIALLRFHDQKLYVLPVTSRKRFRYQSGHVLVLQPLHRRPIHLEDQLTHFQPSSAISRTVLLQKKTLSIKYTNTKKKCQSHWYLWSWAGDVWYWRPLRWRCPVWASSSWRWPAGCPPDRPGRGGPPCPTCRPPNRGCLPWRASASTGASSCLLRRLRPSTARPSCRSCETVCVRAPRTQNRPRWGWKHQQGVQRICSSFLFSLWLREFCKGSLDVFGPFEVIIN